jgi:hypothetical protein
MDVESFARRESIIKLKEKLIQSELDIQKEQTYSVKETITAMHKAIAKRVLAAITYIVNIKKINLIIVVVLITLLTMVGCSSNSRSRADYLFYQSQELLINNADVIILGEITKVNEAEKININANKEEAEKNKREDLVTYTVSEIKISEVLKGDIKKDQLIKVKCFLKKK